MSAPEFKPMPNSTNAPRRRGRPPKACPQFPGVVVRFDSRPRLVVGDAVELCRSCLPGNRGKLAVVTGFDNDGFVLVRSMYQSLDSVELETGKVSPSAGLDGRVQPENLYRRSRDLVSQEIRRRLIREGGKA